MKNRDISFAPMTLQEIADEMKDRGLIANLREFSMDWMGKSPLYFNTQGERASIESCFFLWDNLVMATQHDLAKQVMMRLRAMVQYDMFGSEETRAQMDRIKALHDKLISDFEDEEEEDKDEFLTGRQRHQKVMSKRSRATR